MTLSSKSTAQELCHVVTLLTPVVFSGFEFWNFTYALPAGSSEVPSINFVIELA